MSEQRKIAFVTDASSRPGSATAEIFRKPELIAEVHGMLSFRRPLKEKPLSHDSASTGSVPEESFD